MQKIIEESISMNDNKRVDCAGVKIALGNKSRVIGVQVAAKNSLGSRGSTMLVEF